MRPTTLAAHGQQASSRAKPANALFARLTIMAVQGQPAAVIAASHSDHTLRGADFNPRQRPLVIVVISQTRHILGSDQARDLAVELDLCGLRIFALTVLAAADQAEACAARISGGLN